MRNKKTYLQLFIIVLMFIFFDVNMILAQEENIQKEETVTISEYDDPRFKKTPEEIEIESSAAKAFFEEEDKKAAERIKTLGNQTLAENVINEDVISDEKSFSEDVEAVKVLIIFKKIVILLSIVVFCELLAIIFLFYLAFKKEKV